jgi:hypothetical protein
MKLIKLLLSTLLLFMFSCNKKLVNNHTQDAIAVDSAYVGDYSYEEPNETRLRFSGYTVVFNDFKGYDLSYGEHEIPAVIFGGNENNPYAVLNSDERGLENYIETVIVKQDSVYLSEDMDERINNTLIQIIPQDGKNRFKISMCYLTTLNEITDHRKHTSEELEKIYEAFRPVKEVTAYTAIKDSADYYFRALPHTADMEAITVVDGEIVPVKKRNTKKQVEDEEFRYNKELERIKKKYSLRDTLVVIPGEYDTVATLTKDKKLYGYGYDFFLFKIERYNKNKKIDTKYIVVSIMYGC